MTYNCMTDSFPRARKPHVCDECRRSIPKGTVYQKQTGIYDGEPYTWKVHKDCAGLFFKINGDCDRYGEEQVTLMEHHLCDVQQYRGYFPHAVCRVEFKRDAA